MRIKYTGRIPVRDRITIFPPIDQFWLHGIGRLWSHKHTLYTSWFLGEKNLEYFPFYFVINWGETRVGWGTVLGFKDKNESPVKTGICDALFISKVSYDFENGSRSLNVSGMSNKTFFFFFLMSAKMVHGHEKW